MEPNYELEFPRCEHTYWYMQGVQSDEQLMNDAVNHGDVPMIAFLHMRDIEFDAEKLMFSAAHDMFSDVVEFLMETMLIIPSLRAITKSLDIVTSFADDFDVLGIWSPFQGPQGLGRRRTAKNISSCVRMLVESEHSTKALDTKWVDLNDRLTEITKEMESFPQFYPLDVIRSHNGPARCLICCHPGAGFGLLHGSSAHVGVCKVCAEQVLQRAARMRRQPVCPFCRAPVERFFEAFSMN